MEIRFYSPVGRYDFLSNYYEYFFRLDGRDWCSVEHYYQAQKFAGTPMEERVLYSKTPAEAKVFAHGRRHLWRPDWEQVKCEVMRKAVMAKFSCSTYLREELIKTNDTILIENSKNDLFWGIGSDNSGKNMLGAILMETRRLLRDKYNTNKIIDISLIKEGDTIVEEKLKECEGLKVIYPFEKDWNAYRHGYINGLYPWGDIKKFIDTLRGMDCKEGKR